MQRFKNILLLHQKDSDLEDSKKLAFKLANKNKAKLTILEVLPYLGDYSDIFTNMFPFKNSLDTINKKALEYLREIYINKNSKGLNIDFLVVRGRPTGEISRMILSNGFDLLIKSSDSINEPHNRLFGPLDMRLLRKCPCPVLIVNKGMEKNKKQIAAAIDGMNHDPTRKALNEDILNLGWGLSKLDSGSLDVLNVWGFDAENFLRGSMKSAELMQYEMEVLKEHNDQLYRFVKDTLLKLDKERIHALKGRVSERILNYIQKHSIDVLVMGTVARTGIPGLLIGNTAERILSQLPCSVLALKPKGFVCPVTTLE